MAAKKGCARPISNRGRFERPVLADECDLHLFTTYNWSDNGNGYLRAFDKETCKNVYLHRVVMDAKPGQFVDHINGDTYDIRRANLRFITHNNNLLNNKRHRAAVEWSRDYLTQGAE